VEASEVRERVRNLVREHRAQCLWFLREDFVPSSREEMLRALEHIKRNGDRKAFLDASELSTWLSHHTSETSATS
jgi:hypothetical protein